jgi:hypothetical protein
MAPDQRLDRGSQPLRPAVLLAMVSELGEISVAQALSKSALAKVAYLGRVFGREWIFCGHLNPARCSLIEEDTP